MQQTEVRLSRMLVNTANISNEIRLFEETFRDVEAIDQMISRTVSMLHVINLRLQRMYSVLPVNSGAEMQLEEHQIINR